MFVISFPATVELQNIELQNLFWRGRGWILLHFTTNSQSLRDYSCLSLVPRPLSLVSPDVPSFDEINEGTVNHPVSARGGIIACEIPVAEVVGTRYMQVFNGLVYNFNISFHIGRFQHLCDFV